MHSRDGRRPARFAGVATTVGIGVEGASLNVRLHGEGAPLLLVHGFPLDHTQWDNQLQALASWRAIAPDLRGAGRSDAPEQGYSIARYADDLVAVLDALGAERAVCCGFSMGGYVLLDLWRRHRERVRALILCDTKAEADTPEGRRARDEHADLVRREGMAALAERLLPRLVGRTTTAANPALVERVRAMMVRTPPAGAVGALRAMRDRRDASDILGGVSVPTLLICGAEDVLTPPAMMRALAGRMPAARCVEIPLAGHLSPMEQPERVSRALEEFLREVGRS